MNENDDFKVKNIQVFNKGTYSYLNVEEVIAQKINHTRGWKCMAGINNLYIDYDGNVFVCNNASSKLDTFDHKAWANRIEELKNDGVDITTEENQENGLYKSYLKKFNRSGKAFKKTLNTKDPLSFKNHWGFLGNINQNFEVNKDVLTCPYETCGCGADIPIAKAKNIAVLNQITNLDIVEDFEQLPNQKVLTLEGMRSSRYPNGTILWDLGRRCNYDCSYCWPGVHNAKEEHKEIELLIRTCDKIMRTLLPQSTKTFCFSGGEPTLHPEILTLTKFISDNRHNVLITSNGSMKSERWAEIVPYIDSLQLSAHFEFINEKRFVKNFEIFLKSMFLTKKYKYVDVKLMTPPKKLEKSKALYNRIKEITEKKTYHSVKEHIGISFVPLRGLDDSENILEYSSSEIDFFSNQS